VSLEKAAQRCISVLLELIQTKVNYVVQEAVIVIKVGAMQRGCLQHQLLICCSCHARA
jgi:AP-1 complex subunit beta-1